MHYLLASSPKSLDMKRVLFVLLIIVAAFSSSMQLTNENKNMAPAIRTIRSLYEQHVESLDSFLKVYPTYFYDSSYSVRERKYEELAYHFKRAAGLLIYFEPDLYYKKLIGPFKFEKSERKGFFGFIPDNW